MVIKQSSSEANVRGEGSENYVSKSKSFLKSADNLPRTYSKPEEERKKWKKERKT
jgi:hypothetical protein